MLGGFRLQAASLQNGPFATPKQHLIACRNRAETDPQKWPFATAKQHLIACRNRAQTHPQKLPNAPSEFLEKISLLYFICFLQLLFGGSKLQASGFQKEPFATAKQHLIACRNRAQTYPQKLPNVPSEFLEKMSVFFCLLQLLFGGAKLQASVLQNGPFATPKQHLIACRNRAETDPQKWPFATAKQHLIACRNRAQTHPQKLPNAPSEFLEKISLLYFICFLQLLFGGSKLQASGFQKEPFATAKQHLIACRNRAQTYPQKLPNVPSEFLEKMSVFFCLLQLLFGGAKLQASVLQNGPFATAKQHLIACRNRAQIYPDKLPNVPSEFLENLFFCLLQLLFGGSKLQASGFQNGPFATAKQHLIGCRNRAQTYQQKLPNVPSEFLEKNSLFCLLQLLFGGSKLQASAFQNTLRHSKTAPNCVPKPCSNLPQKLPNAPSEFLEKISFSVSCSCCLVAPSCKHQASRRDPSPQQNST